MEQNMWIVKMGIEEIMNSSSVTRVMIIVGVVVICLLIWLLWWFIKREFKRMTFGIDTIRADAELMKMEITAQNYALGKSFANGFEGYRTDKLAELKSNAVFVQNSAKSGHGDGC